ncbi:MAG: 4'-phosphopantetheinyl transferase superfamily protein [Bacteroidaceae bacterium]|nr:4'-phosphopantetheinyl transferase superfamily protein [Bacteroidaceae bacterium]
MLLINDRLHDIDLADAMPRLSEERRRKLLQLRNENERRASAAGYLLLCRCLQQKYGIDELPIMEYGQYGKPRIVGHENVHFNISHCRCAVICAVSDSPIGVDIETTDRYSPRLAEYTMNSDELQQIQESENPAVEFTRLWTMKEAFLKMTGRGITKNIKNVLTGCTAHIETTLSPDGRYVYSVARP